MTARSSHRTRPASPAAATPPTSTPWNWAPDFGQPLAVANAGGAVLFRGLDAMRRIQQDAAQQALLRRVQAAHQLGAPVPPAALLALQAELLRTELSDATRCWQLLVGEAMEMNNALIGCATRMVNTEDVFAAARLLHA